MEEIKKSTPTEHNTTDEVKQDTSVQYLYAVIKTADWLDTGYKKFAEKYKNDSMSLRELYLCFCDKVPLEVLNVAAQKKPADASFRLSRRKHIESEILKEYSNELEEIRQITVEMDNAVKNMSGTVNLIAASIPTLDEMFQENLNKQEERHSELKPKKEKAVDKSAEKNKAGEEQKMETVDVPKSGMNKMRQSQCIKEKLDKIFQRFQKKPAGYVIKLMEEHYSVEQIEFILECVAEGLTKRDINQFIDPKIPVDLMRKLKNMQFKYKEDIDNGK